MPVSMSGMMMRKRHSAPARTHQEQRRVLCSTGEDREYGYAFTNRRVNQGRGHLEDASPASVRHPLITAADLSSTAHRLAPLQGFPITDWMEGKRVSVGKPSPASTRPSSVPSLRLPGIPATADVRRHPRPVQSSTWRDFEADLDAAEQELQSTMAFLQQRLQ